MLTNVPIPKTAPRERGSVNRARELSGGLEKGANREGNAPLLARTGGSPRCGCGRAECREMLALLGLHAKNQWKSWRRME